MKKKNKRKVLEEFIEWFNDTSSPFSGDNELPCEDDIDDFLARTEDQNRIYTGCCEEVKISTKCNILDRIIIQCDIDDVKETENKELKEENEKLKNENKELTERIELINRNLGRIVKAETKIDGKIRFYLLSDELGFIECYVSGITCDSYDNHSIEITGVKI